MRVLVAMFLVVACLSPVPAQPVNEEWQWAKAAKVRYPANIFPIKLGRTERYEGEKFGSADGSAILSIYSFNNQHESPAAYLNRTLIVDPKKIIYKRVTPRFFVISDIRNENIYYSRCNFGGEVRCIFLEYPAAQKVRWDRVVTRISHSLN